MKILPVQNYYCKNNTYQVRGGGNSELAANVVSFASAKSVKNDNSQISFTSLQTTALTLAKKIPLDDRLAAMFQVARHGDIVVTAKSLKDAQKALKESSGCFQNIIKRFLYVEDENMQGTAAFLRNAHDELEVINPNKFDMFLIDQTGQAPIKQGESFYVLPGDTVKVNDTDIVIKDKPKADLSLHRHIFSRVFDLTNDVKPAIQKQNLKSILSLVKQDGVKGKKLTFADVGGQDKVINDLKKGILYPVKYPEAYENSIVNHGFIMYGPPGTGKTLIAQALANETSANFVKLNGLEMESKWVGESEENWRNLFELARENQPSIIFIDEFDAVAKKRSGKDVYGDKVVNQLLTLMSDVEKNGDDIYVIAATNKLNMLDDAITRSGRFGQHIEVKAPDTLDGILKIFDIHTRNKSLSSDIDKNKLAKELLDMKTTGADISHIVNAANENAFERTGIYKKMEDGSFTKSDIDSLEITSADFSKAVDDFSNKSGKTYKPIGFRQYEK